MAIDKDGASIKRLVQEYYAGRAGKPGACGCCASPMQTMPGIGGVNYDKAELEQVPYNAYALSFGCGNPLALAAVNKGDIVVDIGSGAGLDAILAARAVGDDGWVFGIDMTPEMIALAEENAREAGLFNLTFLHGEAENIPLDDNTADWVISNCVINLAVDKRRAFREIYRILKPGGRILISDIVTENLPESLRENVMAWAGCIAGALSEKEYIDTISSAGFKSVRVVESVKYDPADFRGFIEEAFPGQSDAVIRALKENNASVASIRLAARKTAETV